MKSKMIRCSNSIVRPVMRVALAASILACAAFCGAAEADSRGVHPLCQPLPVDGNGPFVELADGSLMTIDLQGTRLSQDNGQTWSATQKVCEGLDGLREGREPASSAIVRTRGGAPVIVYLDSTLLGATSRRAVGHWVCVPEGVAGACAPEAENQRGSVSERGQARLLGELPEMLDSPVLPQ
jgi:hypothetical protein